MHSAVDQIRDELRTRLLELNAAGKLVEAQRLQQRTLFDLEMMHEVGYCAGIENYSRYLSGRAAGEPPPCLFDYLPKDALLVIDESHQTIPQLGAMYKGDRSRKETLVEYGFRLPSALDNRPLRFEEFEHMAPQAIYVSATPAAYEKRVSAQVIEQVVRPTGLTDPAVEIRPVRAQVDDLLSEIRVRAQANERVLVTTLTKRMAEDLTEYQANTASGCATCTPILRRLSARKSSATCAWASSMSSSASICCAKDSTCRRSRWWPSSMPTRKGSCAPKAR